MCVLYKQSEYAGYRSESRQESAARRRANERTHCPKFSIIVFIVLLVKFSDYPNQVLSMKFKMYKKMVKYKER